MLICHDLSGNHGFEHCKFDMHHCKFDMVQPHRFTTITFQPSGLGNFL